MDDCCMEYNIYTHQDHNEQELLDIQAKYLAYLSQFVVGYIWQNESFNLSLVSNQGDGLSYLQGQTNYGENVQDEWFIVYLLFQLSKKYPDISISAKDSDGDFLLIEAAHELPKWLNPETSENRVFIHGGNLHIIPLPSSPREITVFPTGIPLLKQALEIINGPLNTQACGKIQEVITTCISRYPEKSKESFHYAHCLVSPEIKYVLGHKPTLISAAVQAFCYRDPIDMKAVKRSKYFGSERVLARVQFTRCLYAQIMSQQFYQNTKTPSVTSTDYKAHQLGSKLMAGFEILCSKSDKHNKANGKPCGPQWNHFLDCLKTQGYFKNEIEGSKLHQKLLHEAELFYQESFHSEQLQQMTPGDAVVNFLENASINVEEMKEDRKNLAPEDDDCWLNISPDELEKMLKNYSATRNFHDNYKRQKEEDFNLESVTQKVKTFVEEVSSHEGAEFPQESEDQDIDFNPDTFVDTMRYLLEGKPASFELDDEDMTDEDEEINEELCEEDDTILDYMSGMDEELAQTNISKSFEKVSLNNNNSIQDEDSPVDIDLNLVKNFLESFSSQPGLAGPATNIINAMGLVVPRDDEPNTT